MLQNSEENASAGVNLLKNRLGTCIFLWILQRIWEQLFYWKPASGYFWTYLFLKIQKQSLGGLKKVSVKNFANITGKN